jgi:Ca2+-binding EF-hand superfamily protein
MQNRPLIPALILTLSLPAAAVAASAPPSSGAGKAPAPAAKTASILFSEMDADHDSRITRAEWQGNVVSFAQHDANGDGVLAGPEVAIPASSAGSPTAAQPGTQSGVHDRDRLQRLFRNLDDNRDGRLSPTELQAKKKFERLDTNRDKLVSRDEFLKQ